MLSVRLKTPKSISGEALPQISLGEVTPFHRPPSWWDGASFPLLEKATPPRPFRPHFSMPPHF